MGFRLQRIVTAKQPLRIFFICLQSYGLTFCRFVHTSMECSLDQVDGCSENSFYSWKVNLKDVLGLLTKELPVLASESARFVFDTTKVALTTHINLCLHIILVSCHYFWHHNFPLWKIFGYSTSFFSKSFRPVHQLPSLKESLCDEYLNCFLAFWILNLLAAKSMGSIFEVWFL